MSSSSGEIALHVCTFALWTGCVGVFTWLILTRYMRTSASTSDDYFAGGRALRWFIVAGSLMLTNLSTEQLVGLNGNVFADGCLAGFFWETGAALAMVVTATIFLPKYMMLGLTTTSGFLGERFDLVTRTIVSVVFLAYYAVVLCPLVLYTGALAIRNIFELDAVPLWVISTLIGLLGAAYALTGGLKAVAVSDCLNGIGLLIVGLWVPIAALQKLGGVSVLFEEATYLKPLVQESMVYNNDDGLRSLGVPSIPWHTTLTGLTLTNLYYWSTNQVIVQRVLAARTLADGQKGVLFAASLKVVGFTFLCLPGIIGIILVKRAVVLNGKVFQVAKSDEVYPELVKAVMPKWSLGLFAAVMIGSVLSTFNSALNSASTIFGLELYKIYWNKEASERQVVRVATVFGVALTLAAFAIAPVLSGIDSIFAFLQRANTVVSLPIIAIFFVGIASSLPDAFAAKAGFFVGAVACGFGQMVPERWPEAHYLHVFFACFLLAAATIALATYLPALRVCMRQEPRPVPYQAKEGLSLVDMSPWKPLHWLVCSILVLMGVLTLALQLGSAPLFYAFWALWLVLIVCVVAFPTPTIKMLPSAGGTTGGNAARQLGESVAKSPAAAGAAQARSLCSKLAARLPGGGRRGQQEKPSTADTAEAVAEHGQARTERQSGVQDSVADSEEAQI